MCFQEKKRSNLASLPKYFPKHPVLPLRPGIRGYITKPWCRPIPPGKIWRGPGHESTAPSWLEASGATALGDVLIAKYAVWPILKHLPSADCCDYACCPCVCLWERRFQTALEERSLPRWVLLRLLGLRRSRFANFPSDFIHQPIRSQRLVLLLSSQAWYLFSFYKHHQSKVWMHNHISNLDSESASFRVSICFIFMVIHDFHTIWVWVLLTLYYTMWTMKAWKIRRCNWSFDYSIQSSKWKKSQYFCMLVFEKRSVCTFCPFYFLFEKE